MESSILLVDDNPGMIQLMARILVGVGQLRFAINGVSALRLANESPPDVILLDAEMPGMSGYQVCAALKANPELRDVPVIFVTAHSDIEFELRGLEMGAADFIAKPISEPLLNARVRTQLRIKQLTDELRRVAATDGLTEIPNRRSFDEMLMREWLRSLRRSEPISLLMLDVDHFKLYNDCYGHPAGDDCLRRVAQTLISVTRRPGDFVARIGGEEFAVLMPQTARDGAEHMARRVMDGVSSLALPHQASPTAPHVTVSVGIACYDADSGCWVLPDRDGAVPCPRYGVNELLRSADQALYRAKREGRNRYRRMEIDEVDAAESAAEAPTLQHLAGSCGAS
jgi:diguanylate cyclase (GGDEF)-like protein